MKQLEKTCLTITLVLTLAVGTAFAGVPTQLTKAGESYYIALPGSYINCDRLLFAATGDLVNGAPIVKATGALVNTAGLLFESSSTDAKDQPVWTAIMEGTPPSQASLDLMTVVVNCTPVALDNIGLLIGAANGSPSLVTKANDMDIKRVQQALIEKTAGLIAAAQTGTKIAPDDLPSEVLSEMSKIAKKYSGDRMVAFLKAYGKLLNWDDADIARVINLLSSSRIDAYTNAMKWAREQNYAVDGAPTRFAASMEMKPKYDATTRGTIYFDFTAGSHRVSGMRLDSSFQIRKIVKNGKFFVVALQDDGTPLSGQLFVDKNGAGNWVAGTAPMSQRAEILPPTLTVQQGAELTLTAATAGGNTKSAVVQPKLAVKNPM